MRALPLLLLPLALTIACGDKTDDTGSPDGDGDGYSLDEDCDDTDPDVNPGAAERCNGIDDDCDGQIDEEGAAGSDTFFADVDGDGYGDENNTIEICDLPEGYVESAYDCDDTRADVNPTADELCDEVDNDCDGQIDEDADDAPTWYEDADGDGYGDEDSSVEACDRPDGYVADASDCDDSSDARSPDAAEYCDGIDNNCDGHIDEDSALDATTWYLDDDGDGYGGSTTIISCEQPTGATTDDTDCDDRDASTHPGADELCDGEDDDCDGDIDEDAVDAPTWYADVDGDGFGDASSPLAACAQPSAYEANDDDCDDRDAAINPRGTEVCDGADNDCDGVVDASGLVTVDGTTNYAGIGQAVNAALDGSTVMVCDGSYTANVEIDTAIILSSMNGSGAVTIDGDGLDPVITINAAATVTGFTLTDGQGLSHPENPTVLAGGGVAVMTTEPVVLSDLRIIANEADFGGGIFGDEGCDLSLSDSRLELNAADDNGGALYLWDCVASLDGVELEDNFSDYGGALLAYGGTVTLTSSSAVDNYSSVAGGAVFLTAGAALGASADTLFSGNSSLDVGGGFVLDDGSSWSGGQVSDNEADYGGGFVSAGNGGANVIEDLLCSSNQADTGGGGGWIEGELSITSSEIMDNFASFGGGLMLLDATTTVVTTTLEENASTYNGGGVYVWDNSELQSVNSDWGSGSADNNPDDVYVDSGANVYTLYGTGESFVCSSSTGTCS
jgi:hypothetical protein